MCSKRNKFMDLTDFKEIDSGNERSLSFEKEEKEQIILETLRI